MIEPRPHVVLGRVVRAPSRPSWRVFVIETAVLTCDLECDRENMRIGQLPNHRIELPFEQRSESFSSMGANPFPRAPVVKRHPL